MITPYLPTLNLSVDNALSMQQIIHQLITQLNIITDYLNELDNTIDDRVTKQLKGQLEEFKLIIDGEINAALDKSKEYTNLKISEVNTEFLKFTTQIDTLRIRVDKLESELPATEEKLLKVMSNSIKRLENKMDRMLKESVATVSPLTGEQKSASDSIYDLSQIVASFEGLTMGDIIRGSLCDATVTNPPPGSLVPTRQTIDELFTFKNSTEDNYDIFIGYLGYMNSSNNITEQYLTIQDNTIESWVKYSLLAFCCSERTVLNNIGSEFDYYNGHCFNDLFNMVGGVGTYFIPNIHTNKYEIYDNNYLMFARDVGFLDSNNEPYESGIYPL